jgi:hypothetical protein
MQDRSCLVAEKTTWAVKHLASGYEGVGDGRTSPLSGVFQQVVQTLIHTAERQVEALNVP